MKSRISEVESIGIIEQKYAFQRVQSYFSTGVDLLFSCNSRSFTE